MRLYELGVFKPFGYFFGCTFREVFFDSTFSGHPHDNLIFGLQLFTRHQISPPIRALASSVYSGFNSIPT